MVADRYCPPVHSNSHLRRLLVDYVLLVVVIVNSLLVSWFDLRERRAPDILTLGGLGLALALQVFSGWQPLVSAVAGAAIGAFILFLARKMTYDGLGLGDVKFAAFLGAALLPRLLLASLFVSAILALAFAAISYILGGFQKGRKIPFVPFLAFGAILSLLFETWGITAIG